MKNKTAAFLALLAAGCSDKKTKLDCPAPVRTEWDADADLLTDVREAVLGTDPNSADSDGDGYGDYVEVSAGTNPLDATSAPSVQVARVRQITDASDLIGGPRAQGRVGDWLLENDRIRAIVQNSEIAPQMQITAYGGNLVDADVVRAPGEPGLDRVGMLLPFINVATTLRAERMVVVNDGSDGGAAVLRACGPADTVEYLDASTVLKVVGGLTIAWQGNETLPVEVSTDYVLAPGSDTVEIVSTLGNEGASQGFLVGDIVDSGGAEEIFVSNVQGFGELGFAALAQIQPPAKFLAYLGEGSAWGVVPDSDPNLVVTVSGYSFMLQEFTGLFEFIGTDPQTAEEDAPGVNFVKKGGKYSWHRGLKVSDSAGLVEPFSAAYHERRGVGRSLVGSVRDTSGAPVGGARIAGVFQAQAGSNFVDFPLVVTESAADGTYSMTLPDGDFKIAADIEGRARPAYATGDPDVVTTPFNAIPAARVTISAATTALPEIVFSPGGRLAVTAREAGTNAPVPSRLLVVGTDPSPADNLFRDSREKVGNGNVIGERLSKTGDFLVELPAGTYDVYVTRGMEWSLGRQLGAVVGTAGTTNVALTLGRAVETPGWISADFHVHNGNSVDAISSPSLQALNAAAAGLDVLISTDHDFQTDYAPYVASLGLTTSLATLVGNEVTPLSYGHFIAFPLEHRAGDPVGGAFKWTGPPGEAKTPAEIFAGIDAANAGTQIEQACHVRGFKLQAYFTAIELDTATLESKAPAGVFRFAEQAGATPDDTKLFYSGFDAFEMMNGAEDYGTTKHHKMLNDFFTLLSQGLPVVGTGNSDTHYTAGAEIGWPRNYVELANDAPSAFAGQVETFAQAIIDGHLYFTSGPQFLVTVTGNTAGGPGDQITAAGTVDVVAQLEMPDWIQVDTLNIYVNTPNTTSLATEDGNPNVPVPLDASAITLLTTTNGNGTVKRYQVITRTVSVPANGDSWLVVSVESLGASVPTLFPVITKGDATTGVRPFALAGPIFIDGNGDGSWTAPGVQTALASRHDEPRVEEFGPRDVHERPADVREQWERLTRGQHKH